MRDRSPRGVAALLVAVGGVLAGHGLTYRLVAPSAHARETLLAGTGHAYLVYANDLALVLALAAMAAIFLGGLTRPSAGLPHRRALAMRLVLFQTVAFAAMEGLERITAGDTLAGLLHHGLLPVGLATQIAIALGISVLIRWLLRTAGTLAGLFAQARPARSGLIPALAPGRVDRIRSIARSAVGLRGPPSPSIAG
jgi:hypothetical protein